MRKNAEIEKENDRIIIKETSRKKRRVWSDI